MSHWSIVAGQSGAWLRRSSAAVVMVVASGPPARCRPVAPGAEAPGGEARTGQTEG